MSLEARLIVLSRRAAERFGEQSVCLRRLETLSARHEDRVIGCGRTHRLELGASPHQCLNQLGVISNRRANDTSKPLQLRGPLRPRDPEHPVRPKGRDYATTKI